MKTKNSPLLSDYAIAYTWRQLAQRAGLSGEELVAACFDKLGLSVRYATPDPDQVDKVAINVVPCSPSAWWYILEQSPHSLDWVPVQETIPKGTNLPFEDLIPVLFWGHGYEDGSKPFVEKRQNGTVVFYADILAATFFMLSRWEEMVVDTRDEHDRFPSTASVAYKQDFLDRPIVDEYAMILREWIKVLLPDWDPDERSFSVKLSHDIDAIRRFNNGYSLVRTLGGDILKRCSLILAYKSGWDALKEIITQKGSYYINIYLLAELSKKYGLEESAFYFMADGPDRFRAGYDPRDTLLQSVFNYLNENNFEIGFHPGYDTYGKPGLLYEEKVRLESAVGKKITGGRQHFLRFKVPETWQHWEQIGMGYDSTVGYADHEGFRCGTCYSFRPFDIAQDRPLDLLEIPLVVMDGTLLRYQKYTLEESKKHILALAVRCKQVKGNFTMLWHNTSLQGEWYLWGLMYQDIIRQLACWL